MEYLPTRMSRWKLGSMVSKWVITYLSMGYIGGITHLLTFYQLPGTSKYMNGLNFEKLVGKYSIHGASGNE